MKIPFPPQIVLSQNGHTAAVAGGMEAHLIDTRGSKAAKTVSLPHASRLVAFDPQASLFVAAGEEKLSIFQCNPTQLLTTVTIPAPLYRLAVGESGLVAGVAANDNQRESLLFAWRTQQLQPLFSGAGQSLGSVALDDIQLDGQRNRAVYWGLQAREILSEEEQTSVPDFQATFYGDGQRFVRLVSLDGTKMQVLWEGKDAPEAPNGFLLPLDRGRLGAYSREMLVTLASESELGGPWHKVGQYAWGDLETVVASPGGKHLAWLWSTWDGECDRYHLRVALLDGSVIDEVSFDTIGELPVLAVNDEGQVTLVFYETENRIVALTLEGGSLVKRSH